MAWEPARGDNFSAEIAPNPTGPGAIGRVTLRVRYAESDRMGVVFNAHYLTWFEIGRTELMRSAGVPYRSVEDRGFNLPLIEAALRLRLPIRYDDVIVIETRVGQLRSRSILFNYNILLDGAAAAQGSSTHACVRAADGRATAFPEWLAGEIRRIVV